MIQELEAGIFETLGVKVELSTASEPIQPGLLTPREHEIVSRFKSEIRRRSWLTARNALHQKHWEKKYGESILPFASPKGDTPLILFPNKSLSITHSRQVAVVAQTAEPSVLGLGIDLEIGRYPKEKSIRFYLSQPERDWIAHFDEADAKDHRLRLWTIKEALFKANTGKRLALFDFQLENPDKTHGGAHPYELAYASFQVDGGYFSVAVLRGN